jgi:hypothetical protein
MGLFDSLGMDEVESDPNALPDGKWVGEVFKSEFVEKKDKSVAHVITYRVTEGERKGAQRQEWFTLGEGAVKNEAGKIVDVETPTMTETAKPWYKKRLEDLGKPLSNDYDPTLLTGTPVNFGTKKNGAYINVNFVEVREAAAAPVASTPEAAIGSL